MRSAWRRRSKKGITWLPGPQHTRTRGWDLTSYTRARACAQTLTSCFRAQPSWITCAHARPASSISYTANGYTISRVRNATCLVQGEGAVRTHEFIVDLRMSEPEHDANFPK